MSTTLIKLESLITDMTQVSELTLSEMEDNIDEMVNIILKDEDPLHRLYILKYLSAISCNELGKQDIEDVEKRFADSIKMQIEQQNNMLKLKNKEFNDWMKSLEERLSGIRQHTELVKKIVEQFETLKNNKSVIDSFSSIDTTMSSIEEQLKDAVAKRKDVPVEFLNY